MEKLKHFKNTHPYLFLNIVTISLTLLCFSLIIIFTNGQLIFSDDILHHVNRMYGIYEGLQSGQFPVYIYPGMYNGAGVAAPIFYPDFFLYPFALLQFVGVSPAICLYIYAATCLIVTINVFFTLARKLFKNDTLALSSTLLFGTTTYFLAEYFRRFALGEFTAIIFVLLLGLAIHNMLKENYSKPHLLLIAMLGLLLSHTISFVLCVIFLIVTIIINSKKLLCSKDFYIKTIKILALFVLLSFFYLAPFLEMYFADTYLVSNSIYSPHDYATTLADFFNLAYYPAPTMALLPAVLILIPPHQSNMLISRDSEQSARKLLTLILILVLMTTNLFPWIYVEVIFEFVQFPWRLCIFIVPALALLNSYLFHSRIINKQLRTAAIVIICILNLIPMPYFLIQKPYHLDTTLNQTIGREWFPQDVDYSNFADCVVDENNSPIQYLRNDKDLMIEFYSSTKTSFYIAPLVYYKGYQAFIEVDGKTESLEIKKHQKGIKIITKGQSGKITLLYEGTTIQKLAPFVSLITISSIGIFYTIKHLKKKKRSLI